MTIDRRVEKFIAKWRDAGAAERANSQPFIYELCNIIEVEPPQPSSPFIEKNDYVFEKRVPLPSGSTGAIDLYKRGCFILESKQGSHQILSNPLKAKVGHGIRGTQRWDTALDKARRQAESYIRSLPQNELVEGRRPPFLLIADVGYSIDLFCEFSGTGGRYTQYPNIQEYRILIDDLRDGYKRETLHTIWTNPHSLNPTERSARVTREIASSLAKLAKSLEVKYEPERVASFLMRSIFTMFAEDVGLLPKNSFAHVLRELVNQSFGFRHTIEQIWDTMNKGGFSVVFRAQLLRFNGGLFDNCEALDLSGEQIELLADAAAADWREVEPAIFGTLLERALDPIERHKLGAHYTPRIYVESLIHPTIIQPLREEWESVQSTAFHRLKLGMPEAAIGEVDNYLKKLASIRILDPACGTGNFLYMALEQMKRLEGEVQDVRQKLGGGQMAFEMESVRVTPQQFLGIEVNPRAAAIAELVLWIGYLQWHYRTYGRVQPPEPVLRAYSNIECRDALLEWKEDTPYIAKWPTADYIIGNPPFIGDKAMREALGNAYVTALRKTYAKRVPASSDYVMYWWDRAAETVQKSKQKAPYRFGFISTNSIKQVLNRKVVDKYLNAKSPLSIVYAIPDHPWVDGTDGADVRIAMTVGEFGDAKEGTLARVVAESTGSIGEQQVTLKEKKGIIFANLQAGTDVTAAKHLGANEGLATPGVQLSGTGFRLTTDEVVDLGHEIDSLPPVIRPYAIGRDLTQRSVDRYVIDFYGYELSEAIKSFPAELQIVIDRVKPQRMASAKSGNPDVTKYAEEWWLFAKTRSTFRPAFNSISRFIATSRTAKHRIFTFVDLETAFADKIVGIALDDAYYLGVLSSSIHVYWSLRTGS